MRSRLVAPAPSKSSSSRWVNETSSGSLPPPLMDQSSPRMRPEPVEGRASTSSALIHRLIRKVFREVARHLMPRHQLDERWLLGATDLLRLPAPGVEPTRGRGRDRARHIAAQQDSPTLLAASGVRHRYS